MTPYKHAQSSVSKWGGDITAYIEIHNWFDETKSFTGNWTHRALRHHSAGIEWAIEKFGHAVDRGDGRMIPVKLIAEQHVEEDCGFIPTPQDWLKGLVENPAEWMLKVKKTKVVKMTLQD